jgi:hypothetical protein
MYIDLGIILHMWLRVKKISHIYKDFVKAHEFETYYFRSRYITISGFLLNTDNRVHFKDAYLICG